MSGNIKTFLKRNLPVLAWIYHGIIKQIYKVKFAVISSKFAVSSKIQEARRQYLPQYRRYLPGIAVFYLTDDFPKRPPSRQQYAHGGKVKTIYLAEAFPHASPFANILYTVSSIGHPDAAQITARIKNRKLKIIVNQNGVAYPAWHGPGWENANQVHKALIDQANYIIYQSRFCQIGAERFLSPPKTPCEVVYNPVDTKLFTPEAYSAKPKDLTLLLGGTQSQQYRFELAVQTLKAITRINKHVKLIVTGRLWTSGEEATRWARNLLDQLNLSEKVTFTGRYSQHQAPMIFNQAHVLLHTQYNDASPTLVLEAMASGLPVVYLDSGGTPELVADAGIGIPVEQSWDQINLPAPEELANAVLQIMSRYGEFSGHARERAVNLFSLEVFVEKHRRIFEKVLEA